VREPGQGAHGHGERAQRGRRVPVGHAVLPGRVPPVCVESCEPLLTASLREDERVTVS
jgi:hypothetical protein